MSVDERAIAEGVFCLRIDYTEITKNFKLRPESLPSAPCNQLVGIKGAFDLRNKRDVGKGFYFVLRIPIANRVEPVYVAREDHVERTDYGLQSAGIDLEYTLVDYVSQR